MEDIRARALWDEDDDQLTEDRKGRLIAAASDDESALCYAAQGGACEFLRVLQEGFGVTIWMMAEICVRIE